MRHRGDVVSKRQIIDNVWDAHFDGAPASSGRMSATCAARSTSRSRAIQTERGMGYRLAADGG